MNEIRMDFGSPATSPEEFEDLSNLSGYPWLGLDPTDMCDETQSTSSCGSGRDESIHSRFGSTCSSPCDYDSDVAGVFDLTSEFPFPGNDTWPSDLDDLNIVTKETNPQQFIDPTDWTLQSGSPFLMLSERQAMGDKSLLADIELLRIMELTSSQRSQSSYVNANKSFGDCYESSGARPFVFDPNFKPFLSYNNYGSDQAQHQQHQNEEPLLEQKPPLINVEIKQEELSSDESVASDHKIKQEDPPKKDPSKRERRKYVRNPKARRTTQLFEFMLKLLDREDDTVTWVSREEGIFKLLKSKGVAQLWGEYKKNKNMTYESLSRALRHYYAQEILVPVPKKLHYKFCKKTLDDWYKTKLSC